MGAGFVHIVQMGIQNDNAGDDGVEDGECSVTNDDLSRAFAKLLADPDLDLD